jgi:hypothetical protein
MKADYEEYRGLEKSGRNCRKALDNVEKKADIYEK